MVKTRKVSESDDDDGDDDIEQFYQERDDQLRTAVSKTTGKNKKSVSWAVDDQMSDGADEVLAFDDDSMESDLDEDLSETWGTSRKAFYNEDVNGNDEDAQLEEQEAAQIQKRYYEMLEKKDFALDLFQEKPTMIFNDEQSRQRHIVLPDNLLDLSAHDRLQLIRDQSPELESLCQEYKTLFDDLKIYLLPFVQLVIDTSSLTEFQSYSGWQFVLAVLELYLVYCSYLSLYLAMKSKDTSLTKHPIQNDIEQYRNLCALVYEDFQEMKGDLLKLCELLQERKSKINSNTSTNHQRPHLIINNGISLLKKTDTTTKVSLRERMVKRREEKEGQQEEEETKEQPIVKRAITYQMQKNKGLTVRRKKEYRNPRVHHRNKYARALVKRTSRVPQARTEEQKYMGEPTGIRAGLKRGIKLKS